MDVGVRGGGLVEGVGYGGEGGVHSRCHMPGVKMVYEYPVEIGIAKYEICNVRI